jgi:hypothetical protein
LCLRRAGRRSRPKRLRHRSLSVDRNESYGWCRTAFSLEVFCGFCGSLRMPGFVVAQETAIWADAMAAMVSTVPATPQSALPGAIAERPLPFRLLRQDTRNPLTSLRQRGPSPTVPLQPGIRHLLFSRGNCRYSPMFCLFFPSNLNPVFGSPASSDPQKCYRSEAYHLHASSSRNLSISFDYSLHNCRGFSCSAHFAPI